MKFKIGSRIIFLHDSSKCRKCKCYIEFYRKLKRRKSSSQEKDVKYRGIISYCRFILSVEVKSSHLNGSKKQSYDWPSKLSFDCLFNEWNLKREFREKANQYKYSGIKVRIDDTVKRQPKTYPALFVCKEQAVDETNKINFVKGSPSSDNHVEDCNHSGPTRYSKISKRKSYWRAAKDNAAKTNISTESVGTRKRKNITEDLETNGNYEDDLYAKKKFFKIPNMSEENSIGSEILDIATPAFPLTPKERSMSPICEDCYDITELNNCRKGAEKYQSRRNKKKWKKQTSSSSTKNYSSPNERSEPEKTKKRLLETIERLKQVKRDQDNEDSNSDHYFSDLDDEKEYN
ncbi:uncharacterized protein TNCT_509431 [Trichonephila clavata]|uniref:Uncharacterized protein n=1 Tax=Trichonephila clavata TaxID=2740835 RepID=A0A8X6HDP4_TRICU|nr:uncharacterized protein TNCT_509431 [Trichonephila clavata]